jgi:hypothetical protein
MAPPTAIGSPLAGLCPLIRPATIAFAPMLNGSVALDARPTLRNVSHSVRRAGSNSVDTIDIDLNSPDAINTLAVHVDTIGDDVDALGGDVARLAAEVRALTMVCTLYADASPACRRRSAPSTPPCKHRHSARVRV